jgi:hypothetical protein
MSISTPPKIIALAASATVAAGIAAIPFPASAEPDCLDWRLKSDALFVDLNNGVWLGVPWLGGTNKVRTDPGASILHSPDGGVWQGDIDPGGGTYQGSTIKFRINWTQGVSGQHPTSAFTGQIDNTGFASGTMVNEKNEANTWTARDKFFCQARAAEPKPADKPANNPADNPATNQNTGTIIDTVQLFDVPGGGGVWVGDVQKDRKVNVLQRKADNWVQISNSGVDGHDSGWVWGDFVGP